MDGRRTFGILLKEQLTLHTPFDTEKLAFWGECARFKFKSAELDTIADNLSAMSCGPGFTYTKEELEFVADKLIMGEPNAWEQMLKATPIQPLTISRPWLGKELQKQLSLNATYDPAQIALWAENMLICYKRDLPQEYIDILEVLSWMSQKPGFEYSKMHLEFLANKLIANDSDALEQMGKLK